MKPFQKLVSLSSLLGAALSVPALARTPANVPYTAINQTSQSVYGNVTVLDASTNNGAGMNYSATPIGAATGFIPVATMKSYRVVVSGGAGYKSCSTSVVVPSISSIRFVVSPAGSNFNCSLSVNW